MAEKSELSPRTEYQIIAQQERSSISSGSSPVLEAEDVKGASFSLLQVQSNTESEDSQSDSESDSGEDQFLPAEEFIWPLRLETVEQQGTDMPIEIDLQPEELVEKPIMPCMHTEPHEITEELPKEVLLPEERSLNRADYGNSKNAYDMDVLRRVFIRKASGKFNLKDLLKKIGKGILPTSINTLANIVVGEAISFFSSGDSGQTSEQVRAVGVGERIGNAKLVVNKIIEVCRQSNIKPEEIYRESYLEWKKSRKERINRLPKDIRKRIDTLDVLIDKAVIGSKSLPQGATMGLRFTEEFIEEVVWLSNLSPQRKDITHKNNPVAKKEQLAAIKKSLEGAQTEEQTNERLINCQRIINASSAENPEKVVIWRGDLAGGGKSYYTIESAKALGLPLQVVELGDMDAMTLAFSGKKSFPQGGNEGVPLRERMGTLWYDIGDAVVSNTIFYFNEADVAMRILSAQLKKLWDPNQKTIKLDNMGGVELNISHAIFVGDGNTPLDNIADRAMRERMSREDFNVTSPSKRRSALEDAAADAIAGQVLSDENLRSKVKDFTEEMITFILELGSAIGEQSFRPSLKFIKDIAAFAAIKLEQGEEPNLESAKQHVIRDYERLSLKKNIRELLAKKSKESLPSQEVIFLRTPKEQEKISLRVMRIMEANEKELANKLTEEELKEWLTYVKLRPNQKEAATQTFRKRLKEEREGLASEDMIPETKHSVLLKNVPKSLISTHNFLNDLTSPTPTPPSTRPSSPVSTTTHTTSDN